MSAKRTRKNQITLPKAIVQRVGEADYDDVTVQYVKIVLTPVRLQQADAARAKLEALGFTQDDVEDAIAWARKRARRVRASCSKRTAWCRH
jgi:antitoxin component of MazEF toxin-antitoxin module